MGDKPALSADEFFAGKTCAPLKISLEKGYTPQAKKNFESAIVGESTPNNATANAKKSFINEKDIKELKDLLSQKEVTFEALEAKISSLKK